MSDAFSLSSLSAELQRITAAASPGVVAVHSHRSRASGFVWRGGLVVTADEALAEEGEIEVVLPGGATAKATLAGRDPTTNVALLRVDGADATPASLDTGAVKPGALALVVGSREGEPLAALGIVSLAAAEVALAARRRDRCAHRARRLGCGAARRGRPRARCRDGRGIRHGGVRAAPARAGHSVGDDRAGGGAA